MGRVATAAIRGRVAASAVAACLAAVLAIAACGEKAPEPAGPVPSRDSDPERPAPPDGGKRLTDEAAKALASVEDPRTPDAAIEEAIGVLDRAIAPDSGVEEPQRRMFLYRKAQLLLRLRRLEDAAAAQLRLAELEEDPAIRIVSRTEGAASLADAGRTEDAIEVLETGLGEAKDVDARRRWPAEMLLARLLVRVGRSDEGFARFRAFVEPLGDVGAARDARLYWGDELVGDGRLDDAVEVWRAVWPSHRSEPTGQRIGFRLAAVLGERGDVDAAREILEWLERRADGSDRRARAKADRRCLELLGKPAPALDATAADGTPFAELLPGAIVLFWDPADERSVEGPSGLQGMADATREGKVRLVAVALTADAAAAKRAHAEVGGESALVVVDPHRAAGWRAEPLPRAFRLDGAGHVVSYAPRPTRISRGR